MADDGDLRRGGGLEFPTGGVQCAAETASIKKAQAENELAFLVLSVCFPKKHNAAHPEFQNLPNLSNIDIIYSPASGIMSNESND